MHTTLGNGAPADVCAKQTFPLMYQFYHKDFPTQFRAEHQHYCCALHFGKGQLGSFWTVK